MPKRSSSSRSPSSSPPAKRPRRSHMISDILAPTSYAPSRHSQFVRKLDSSIQFNAKFKNGKLSNKFIIEKLPPDPEQLLRTLIQRCIDQAVHQIGELTDGATPDQIGTTISSIHLDTDIHTPFRPLHEDTVDNILNQFMLVVQSRSGKGKGNVLGDPFTITIATTSVHALPRVDAIEGSAAGGRHNPVHHHIRSEGLIVVRNPAWRPYCLFYALELSRQHIVLDPKAFGNYYSNSPQKLWGDVYRLMQAAAIPPGQPTYDARVYGPIVIDYWNRHYAAQGQRFKLFVFGEKGDFLPKFKYGADLFNMPIAICHVGNHFHGVRRAGAMLKEDHKYCFACCTPYRMDRDHRTDCKARCINCGRVGVERPCQPQPGFAPQQCANCSRIFVSPECYAHHLAHECARNRRCAHCGLIWDVKDNTRDGRAGHVCGEKRCNTCSRWHKPEIGCFIQPLVIKHREPYRLVSFDFECTQHEQLITENAQVRQLHQVNFICAHVNCTRCMESGEWRNPLRQNKRTCEICGPDRYICFSVRPFKKTLVDKQINSATPLQEFISWLLYMLPVDYTTMAYSHFGGKYDMVIAFKEIFEHNLVPSIIRRGNKMLQLHVPKVKMPAYSGAGSIFNPNNRPQRKRKAYVSGEIIFQDSFNLLNAALGKLPAAFGLDCEDKPFFPHMANHPRNYGRILPQLPPKSDYLYGGMKPEQQAVFDPWYAGEQTKGTPFFLDEELASYCKSDVEIECKVLMALRTQFMELSDPKKPGQLPIDVLYDAMTMSAGCFQHFRMNHVKPNQLGVMPHNSYDPCDTQSKLALTMLAFYAWHHGVKIRTAMSHGGEKKIGKYKVDGYIAERDMAIEVNGCAFHACECRFSDPNAVVPTSKKRLTVAQIRAKDEARLRYLRRNLRGGVIVFKECEINAMRKNCPTMDGFFKQYQAPRPINLRECFYGGRTGPWRCHYKCPKGWKMGYLDFCSLYPFITATTAYPIGHPIRHIIDGADINVNWTRPEQVPVKGVLEVYIVPPEHCDVPVVPVKFDHRLLFPLCRKCALHYPNGAVLPKYSCPHTNPMDRGWLGFIASNELEEALLAGYKVVRYFRSLEWKEWDDNVFRSYVAQMMELKFHASGFPEGIKTREQEDQFIRECADRFGINIDRAKMRPNKAMREIAKRMNNMLWGRFSLRNNLTKCHITDSPSEYRRFLEDPSLDVNRADELNTEIIMLTYDVLDEFIEENMSSNVMVSLWTTAAARIKLLKELQKIVAAGGKILYTDTDSIIFAYKEANGCPLSTGWHLGDLVDEYPEYDLLEFVSSGCKAYALQMRHKTTGKIRVVMRLRGITLTGDVSKILHYDTFKRCVFKFAERAERMEAAGEKGEFVLRDDLSDDKGGDDDENDWTIELAYPNFLQPSIRHGHVTSRPMKKIYRPVVSKGIVTRGMKIKDFGAR